MKLARSDKVVGNFVTVNYDEHRSDDTSPCTPLARYHGISFDEGDEARSD
jgi:hypothetical protein